MGIASRHDSPTARIADAVCHVVRFNTSVAQYAIMLQLLQFWCSKGVGSITVYA